MIYDEVLISYLSAGYDMNAADYDGRTCLHIAAAEGNSSLFN